MYSKDLFLERAQLALLDAMVVFASLLAAGLLRHGADFLALGADGRLQLDPYLFPATLAAVSFVLLFRYEGLYSASMGRLAEALRVLRASTFATMATLAVSFFYRGYSYSRATIVVFFPLSIGALLVTRSLYRGYKRVVRSNPAARRRVLIMGGGPAARHLGRELLERPSYYDLVGFLGDDPLESAGALDGVPILGITGDLPRVARERGIEEVIIAMPSASRDKVMEIFGSCLRLKVRWKVVPDLYGLRLERLAFDNVGGLPLAEIRGSNVVGFNWMLKRVFDFGIAGAALVTLSPLFLLIALAIKLSSRGPVLYRQTRIGLRGNPFTFFKFRSMRADSNAAIHQEFAADWIYGRTGERARPVPRSLGAAASSSPESEEIVHKLTHDPRITAVGRVLRRTSLDELPQLWNVIRGEMSLVGPRPALPYEVERYTEWHKRRLEVLPGITGLWQVSGRNALSFEDMVRLDVQYIENWTLEGDLKVLFKTVPTVLFGKAY